MRPNRTLKVWRALAVWRVASPFAVAQSTDAQIVSPVTASTVIWVTMQGRVTLSKLQPGSSLEGKLNRAVYWRDREMFPIGSLVRLVVDHVEQKKKEALSDDRPLVIRMFAPKQERFATFRSARVILPDGCEVPLRASFIGLRRRVEVRALARKQGSDAEKAKQQEAKAGAGTHQSQKDQPETGHEDPSGPALVLVLEVEPADGSFSALAAVLHETPSTYPEASTGPATIAPGTRARLVLLQSLSASKNHPGDSFDARLLEPVRLGSRIVLPEGSVFEGLVEKRVPPRRLSRPATLHLIFTKLTPPGGTEATIAASLASAEVDKGSRMKMDSEGALHTDGPGRGRLLLDLGVTAGFAKVTDDST